jgi:hypothetical protein
MKFVVYDKETGRIEATGFADMVEDANAQSDDKRSVLLGVDADDVNQYVKNGEVVDRSLLNIDDAYVVQADGSEKLTIPVPANTLVRFLGQEAILTDKKLEFMTDQPGNYTIELEPPFPLMPKKVVISAL